MEFDMENRDISAQDFVDQLLEEGSKIPCDNTNESFVKQGDSLPPYFDKDLFKKGQELFAKHIYSMNVMHALGIVLLYSIRSAFNVAMSAAGSSTGVFDLYCRQMRTNNNLHSLYYADFKPGSLDWKKITKIKLRHNSVSKGSTKMGFNALTQKEMALGQFFICCLNLVRGELVGLHGVTDEERRGFHHYWRVLGYLVGIEERFNVCSLPMEKTEEISELLIRQLFKPAMDKKEADFLHVAKLACLCWWPILPDLEATCAVNLAYDLVKPNDPSQPTYLKMSWCSRMYYKYLKFTMSHLLKWDGYRHVRNTFYEVNFFIVNKFPIIPKLQCKISNYLYFKV